MTATTDTDGHPDVSEISDLTEGLLTPSRAEDLRRHLSTCADCADVRASLDEIRSLLGTLPAPHHMPSDIADRIDAALAAEPHPAAPEMKITGGARHVSRETSGDVSRETSAPPTADRPVGNVRMSRTGPGRKPRPRRVRRGIAVLGAALTVTALGVATIVLTSQNDDQHASTAASAPSSTSAQTFSEGTLARQVTSLLDGAPKTHGTTHAPHSFGTDAGPDTGAGPGATTRTSPATAQPHILKDDPTVAVPSCVRQGIDSTGAALAAQPGLYAGRDAYLVVLSDPSGASSRVTAYVVDASCVHDPAITARVLLSHTYTRS
ncbi:membrane protein [Streptomyces sp. Tu 6176]|uniref:anti-sigma factor family protein n=1 Tax=Streptomyces sp. Tu 6176 TaxID=1470557 RepID=UPI00044BA11C|nr:anti-sigma factor [Streptomyces sp. Tu 6176]EYT80006.1 membrane protein [Streptomyces sp. Tu 6176]